MNNKRKPYAVLTRTALAALLVGVAGTNASAAVDKFLVTDNNGKYVQYDYNQLRDSYYETFDKGEAKLYKDFTDKKVVAFHDDQTQNYVDYDAIRDAYMEDIKNFDVDTFTQKATGDSLLKEVPADINERALDKDGNIVNKPVTPPVTDGLKVESVSAINGTEVTVKLAAKPAGNLTGKEFKVSDSNGVAYSVTSVAPIDDVTYKITLDKAVSGKGILTVNGTKFDFNTVDIVITSKADKTELNADGKDNTTIVYTATKNGVVDTAFKGTVKVISTKGARFAKDVIAFDKGVAKIQITSLSSEVDVEDKILAIIQDSDDKTLVGKSLEPVILKYIPMTGPGAEVGIQAVYAQANDAANVIVKFNKDVNIDTIRKNLANVKIYQNATNAAAGVSVIPIDAVLGEDNKIVRFILPEGSALTDNNTITVKIEQKDGVFYGSETKFNLVDARAPQAVGVATPDYRTIVAEFTEPISKTAAVVPENWVINGVKLQGTDATFIAVGKHVKQNDDEVLTTKEQIIPYDVEKHIDNRNFVTIRLTSDAVEKLYREGGNLLQATNIIDYAGLTDKTGQNKAATQEFTFDTPKAPNAPLVESVTMDSPEQFKVKFNEPLKAGVVLDKNDIKVYYVKSVDKDGKQTYEELADYVVDVNTKTNKEYVIHLNKDWTQIYKTSDSKINYYTPGYNNVVIAVKKDRVKNFLDVDMEKDYNLYNNLEDIATKATKITMSMDVKEPTAKAEQSKNDKGEFEKSVKVTASEPVQIPGSNTSTPSEQQKEKGNVPVPTFQFVSEDMKTTIDAKVSVVEYDNMSFTVDASKLTDGKWTLYIRSISDDIGNTSNTITCPFEYTTPSVETNNKPYIVWAKAIDNYNGHDILKIQYSVDMSVDALRTQYYSINGKNLPEGTRVTAVDSSNTGLGTLVTIELPQDFFIEDEHILTVSNTLKDAKGNVITGDTQVKTEYIYGNEVKPTDVTGVIIDGENLLDSASDTIDLTKLTADKDGKVTIGVPTLEGKEGYLDYAEYNTLTLTLDTSAIEDATVKTLLDNEIAKELGADKAGKVSEVFNLLNKFDADKDGKVLLTNLAKINNLKITVEGKSGAFTVKAK